MNSSALPERGPSVCVIGAGPCGLTTVKNLLALGLTNVLCYEESGGIGGNWAFSEDPTRMTVYESAHLISSRTLSGFEDFPIPDAYPDYPSQKQMLAYFESYARRFDVKRCVRFNAWVEQVTRDHEGRWTVRVSETGSTREERFDYLLVCAGHHRDAYVPDYPGRFSGEMLHSGAYKRPEPFREKRVLVVGAGNSACDIAVDISRVAASTAISIRRGCYIVPKIIFGRPVDVLYARTRKFPRFLWQPAFRLIGKLTVGPWEKYGLPVPAGGPFEIHPTLNTNILSALRDGMVLPRAGIERLDGERVHFVDGSSETFDVILWGTGFRTSMPFLDTSVVDWDTTQRPPLYLKMMHRSIENLFFIGLFQPIGCIWRLADHQARIAALQIAGRLDRPSDIDARIEKEMRSPHWAFQNTPRHAIEVDYHDFRRELFDELARARSEAAPARAA